MGFGLAIFIEWQARLLEVRGRYLMSYRPFIGLISVAGNVRNWPN
jgi:hypothetical protein